MVKKRRFRQRRNPSTPQPVSAYVYTLLEKMGGSKEQSLLTNLWENWAAVVGNDIAAQIAAVAHKNHVLILTVEDSALIQELSFLEEEILANVNQFLGKEFFTRIRFILLPRK